jgi:hypothetical protein
MSSFVAVSFLICVSQYAVNDAPKCTDQYSKTRYIRKTDIVEYAPFDYQSCKGVVLKEGGGYGEFVKCDKLTKHTGCEMKFSDGTYKYSLFSCDGTDSL